MIKERSSRSYFRKTISDLLPCLNLSNRFSDVVSVRLSCKEMQFHRIFVTQKSTVTVPAPKIFSQ